MRNAAHIFNTNFLNFFYSLGGNYIGPQATKNIIRSLDPSMTANNKYFKLRGPAEPMKFYRKKNISNPTNKVTCSTISARSSPSAVVLSELPPPEGPSNVVNTLESTAVAQSNGVEPGLD